MARPDYEFLPPLIVAERQAEARREALADLAPPRPGIGDRLALNLGTLLIRAGCRLESIGRRHEMLATPFAPPPFSVVGDHIGVRKRAER